MASDLTERLAAKLNALPGACECVDCQKVRDYAADAGHILLPLLLSEPELVASLPEEVRAKALESLLNSAPVMESAFVDAAEVLALAPEEVRLSVLTPRERAGLEFAEKRRERVVVQAALEHSAMILKREAGHPEHAAMMERFANAQDAERDAGRAFDLAAITPEAGRIDMSTAKFFDRVLSVEEIKAEHAALAEVAALTPEGKDG